MAMIGTRHYERIMTLPAYAICRKTLALLALLMGVLPVLLYIIAVLFTTSLEGPGPWIRETPAIVLTIFLAVFSLISPLTAAVLNKVLVEKNIGRPPFRFLYVEDQQEAPEGGQQPEKKPFEPQFNAMFAILFAIADATGLFGLILGVLGKSFGLAAPFFAFSLIFTGVLYFMLKNQLFSLLSEHFDLIEGGGRAKLAE
ncbi:hypothetical protein HQ563_07530 [bacterium]|nr:hypothetical protein [bacterium]